VLAAALGAAPDGLQHGLLHDVLVHVLRHVLQDRTGLLASTSIAGRHAIYVSRSWIVFGEEGRRFSYLPTHGLEAEGVVGAGRGGLEDAEPQLVEGLEHGDEQPRAALVGEDVDEEPAVPAH